MDPSAPPAKPLKAWDVTGRRVGLSLPRAWIGDLLAHGAAVPTVTFERRMHLAEVAAARAAVPDPPGWVVLFVKAYSAVAARRPELRRAYLGWPWPHLYEADYSIASVAVEREFRGEPAVFFGLLAGPDRLPLATLQQAVGEWKTAAVESVRPFRRLVRYTRWPRPVRRLLWWYAMHTSGRKRARNFGTFGISVTAGMGATALNLIAPLATTLNYGVFAEDGSLDVRLHFDHRVTDGAPVARALAELEQVLNGEIAAELVALSVRGTLSAKAVDVIVAK
jgi:hypothetical protein